MAEQVAVKVRYKLYHVDKWIGEWLSLHPATSVDVHTQIFG